MVVETSDKPLCNLQHKPQSHAHLSLHLTVAVALVCVLCVGLPTTSEAQNRKPAVEIAMPLVKKVREWDEYTGRFQPVEHVELRSRVSGYLNSIQFKDGQIVEQGDLLFKIDPRPFEAQLAAARARVESAKAQLKLAEAELQRGRQLQDRKVVSDAEIFNRQAEVDVRAAGVLVSEAELESARLNLEFTEIRAPVKGRISNRRVNIGNLIAGGTGATTTLLTTINSLDPIHFVFDVSEQAYLKYARLGRDGSRPESRNTPNPVYVQIADEDGWPHRGAMDFVDNEVGQETGTVRGRAILPNKDAVLQPGLFGRVRLVGSGEYEAVLIPDKAILSDQATRIVMVVDGKNKVSIRKIEPGPIIDGLRVVKKGLSADERIVVAGVQRVKAGQEVEVTEVKIEAKQDGFDPTPIATTPNSLANESDVQ